jgi:hypothetical protein
MLYKLILHGKSSNPGMIILLIILHFFNLCLQAQTPLGFLKVQGSYGILNLRVISVAEAMAAGNGVVKIRMGDGTDGAADLVPVDHANASSVRVQTPYGTRSWRQDSQFAFVYGGANVDGGNSLVKTSDGGFAIGGVTKSWGAGSMDQMTIKTDADGNISWAGAYGYNLDDYGAEIIQRADGGYLQVGNTWVPTSFYMYVNFINPDGSLQMGGYWLPPAGHTDGRDVIQCTDGNFVAVGEAWGFGGGSNDVYIKKFDNAGVAIWTYTIGGTTSEEAYALVERPDGGFIAVGQGNPGGNQDALYYAIDPNGMVQYGYLIGGTGLEAAYSVVNSLDDGYVFVGFTTSWGSGGHDIYIRKQNGSSVVWAYAIGGTGDDYGHDIIRTSDGGFAIAGVTYTYGNGGGDMWLIKTDSQGNPEWSWVFGSAELDVGNSLVQTADGRFYVAGGTNAFQPYYGDVLLVEFAADGSACTGYAVDFNNDMIPVEEETGFKASRVVDFNTIISPKEQVVVRPASVKSLEKFVPVSSESRVLVSPTTTVICN